MRNNFQKKIISAYVVETDRANGIYVHDLIKGLNSNEPTAAVKSLLRLYVAAATASAETVLRFDESTHCRLSHFKCICTVNLSGLNALKRADHNL